MRAFLPNDPECSGIALNAADPGNPAWLFQCFVHTVLSALDGGTPMIRCLR